MSGTTLKKAKRKLTPKQRVLRRWPCAYAWLPNEGEYQILHDFLFAQIIGSGKTAAQAWADAARRGL